MLLHVFAHVDAHHGVLVVEQKLRQRAGGLGLADAGGAEEDERADGPVRVLQAAAGTAHGVGHGFEGLLLADDALFEPLLHLDQLLALAFEHPGDGNAGPGRHDLARCLPR